MKIDSKNGSIRSIFAGIAFFAGLFVLVALSSRSQGFIWKGYRMLALPLSADEQTVCGLLARQGIRFVSESNSRIENTNPEAPVQPFLSGVNERRASWFRLPGRETRLLYLEESPFLEAGVKKALTGTVSGWNLEQGTGVWTPVLPALVLALFAGLLFFSRSRLLFWGGSIPFLLLPATCNRVPAFAASVFVLLFLFSLDWLFRERERTLTGMQRVKILRKNPFFAVPFLVALCAVAIDGPRTILPFATAAATSLSGFLSARRLERLVSGIRATRRLHPVFRPVLISIPTYTWAEIRRNFLPFTVFALIALLAGMTLSGHFQHKKGQAPEWELYTPAPSGYTVKTGFDVSAYTELVLLRTGNNLPDLGDFIADQWELRTFSYRRVQDAPLPPREGSTVEYTGYATDGNGVVTGSKRTLYTFDTGFIRKVLSSYSTPLENMLQRQGRFVTVEVTGLKK